MPPSATFLEVKNVFIIKKKLRVAVSKLMQVVIGIIY